MTKVDAIEKLMMDNGGSATLQVIYNNIEKYCPSAKASKDWAAGIRGVLYRELAHRTRFKKMGLNLYALSDYAEEKIAKINKIRRHSLFEGICIELGNAQNFNKSNLPFSQFAFAVVDGIMTLNGALNRRMQLHGFRTKFFIVAPEEHRAKHEQTMNLAIYRQQKDLF